MVQAISLVTNSIENWGIQIKIPSVSKCYNYQLSIIKNKIKKGKLHFTTLNYTLDYTLHTKLFECSICTLNYDTCYTLHPDISFTVILDRTFMHMTHTCIFLRWNKVKRQKHYSSQSIKTKTSFLLFFQIFSPLRVQPYCAL